MAARHLIEEGPEFEEKVDKLRVKSYLEEQEEFRRAFLEVAEEALDGDDDGELLRLKESKSMGDEDDSDAGEVQKNLDEYFGKDDHLNENKCF